MNDPRYTQEGEPPLTCACCTQPSQWVGYRPAGGMPFIFLCGNRVCQDAAPGLYKMSEQDWRDIADAAIWDGGKAGGRYLDGIGKTDIGALSKPEYFTFLKTVHEATAEALRTRLAAVIEAEKNGGV